MINQRQSFYKIISFLLAFVTLAIADVEIITKTQWNGRESKEELSKLQLPVRRAIIAHTATGDCNTLDSCAQQLRSIQNYHMDKASFDDIAYNFLIGNDGNVYEGRGWDSQGAFALGYNAGSLGIAFIGTYDRSLPTPAALDAAKSLLEKGLTLGKLTSDYKLYGHRQLVGTNSPGSLLYDNIKTWPHWSREVETN